MKKILMVAVVAMFGAVALTSCDKEVDCKCTESNTGVSSTSILTKSECEDLESELKSQGQSLGQDWSCTH